MKFFIRFRHTVSPPKNQSQLTNMDARQEQMAQATLGKIMRLFLIALIFLGGCRSNRKTTEYGTRNREATRIAISIEQYVHAEGKMPVRLEDVVQEVDEIDVSAWQIFDVNQDIAKTRKPFRMGKCIVDMIVSKDFKTRVEIVKRL
ncbi:hypothetical protein [Haloferula sp. BvORR071]|uniref:hypothetical protein n=1 Tax=Haloferula sp. BvORR071 TaxID=1396141 RepID=UPI002240F622|nr:hypothetical protein [Haloferula sp. BvORR071]